MHNNKAEEFYVGKIEYTTMYDKGKKIAIIQYGIYSNVTLMWSNTKSDMSRFYRTKEELIKSLC